MSRSRYWLLLRPDVNTPIGGVKQMHRLAECLSRTGRDACVVQDSKDFHPGWFSSTIKTIAYSDLINSVDLSPARDVFILPETYVPQFASLFPSYSKIIFNQNASYTFGVPSKNIFYDPLAVLSAYKDPSIIHVLTVSSYDKSFLVDDFLDDFFLLFNFELYAY